MICSKDQNLITLSRDGSQVFSIRVNQCVDCTDDNYWDNFYLSKLVFETRMISLKMNITTGKSFAYEEEFLTKRMFINHDDQDRTVSKIKFQKKEYNLGAQSLFTSIFRQSMWDFHSEKQMAMSKSETTKNIYFQ